MIKRIILLAGVLIALWKAADAQTHSPEVTAELQRARALYAQAKSAEDSMKVKAALEMYRESLRLSRESHAPQSEISVAIIAVGRMHAAIKEHGVTIDLCGKEKTVDAIISFRIARLLEHHGKTHIVTIDGGSVDGIFKGGKGEALGTYSDKMPNRGGNSLGKADVISVEPNSSTVEVVLSDTSSASGLLYEGDMVSVPATIPVKAQRSVFFDLSKMNIEFLTKEKLVLYHTRQILQDDSPLLEHDILSLMAEDVRETVPRIQDLAKENPAWSAPMKEGKFAGVSLLDGMSSTTAEDVGMFIRFVRSLPGKYMGHTWKINETYATWMMNGTPLGDTDLRDTLLAALDNGTLKETLTRHSPDWHKSYVETWGAEALNAAKKGDPARAVALCDVSLRMAEAMQDSDYVGWAHFNKARVLDEEKKYEACMAEYELALKSFRAARDLPGEYSTLNNIAGALNSLDRYEEALVQYSIAIELKLKRLAQSPSNQIRLSIGSSAWGRGNALFNLGRYPEAIASYDKAMAFYDSVNTLESTRNKATVLRQIARIHEKRSDYEKALAVNTQIARTRRDLADREGEADALDNVAYCTSQLGKKKEALELYTQAYEIQIAEKLLKDAGFSRSNMGQVLWTIGEYKKAIEAHKEAIALRERAKDKSGQAYSWGKLASLYKETADPHAAIEAYAHVIELNQEAGSKADLAQTYHDMGDLYHSLRDYRRAIAQFEKALAIRKEIRAQSDIASTLFSMSWAYLSDKNFAQADSLCTQALAIQTELGDKSAQLSSMVTLGHIGVQGGKDPKTNETWYRKAFALAGETQSKDDSAYCLRYIAYMENNQGKTQAAYNDLTRTLALYESSGDRSKLPDILADLGGYALTMGDFAGATSRFEWALALADSTKNRTSVANALTSLGDMYRVLGEYTRALECLERALKVASEVDNQWAMASAHLGLGNAHNYAGEFRSAIREYELADSLYNGLGVEVSRATTQNNIGTIHYWGGDYDNALSRFKEAYAIWQKAHIEGSAIATVKVNIGETYFRKKSYGEAHPWLAEALAIARDRSFSLQVAEIQSVIGKLYLAEGNYDEARAALGEAYELARTMGQKERIADVAGALGQLHHETRNDTAAIRCLEESIALSRKIGSTKYLWEPLYTLGLVYSARNETDRAISTLKDAVSVVEEIRGKVTGGESGQKIFSSGASKVQVYESLVSLLMKSGNIEEAFNYLERSNNQGLREHLGPMAAQLKDPSKNSALVEHRELKNKVDGIDLELARQSAKPDKDQNTALIASLRQRKQIAESQYTKFVNETIKNQRELAEYFSDGVNPLELREAKRDIPKDVAVVAYLTGEQQLYIFVATSDSVGAQVIDISRNELRNRIGAIYDVIHRPSAAGAALASVRGVKLTPDESRATETASLPRLSEDLYSLLIGPIESKLKGKKKLAVIANAELNYLPFQILGRMQGDGTFRLVVDDWSVFYVMRMKVFTEAKAASGGLKIAAFGNADSSLPNAELEVKELKKLYANASVFVRHQATKEKVLSLPASFSAIHFATHGILDYSNIENSYLVLAPENNDPASGHLTIDEVTQMTNLYDTRLVTLSACNTAIGKEMIKGWLINPANAFLRSGVRTVVASLWQVDDAATSILMREFYKNLKSMEAVEALRSAQMAVMRNARFAQPYFWAGFVLIGQWR